jgi:uncharacterized damage-inducible protein DinB
MLDRGLATVGGMNTSLLRVAFDHHAWANARLLDVCATLTPDQLETTVPGTYGSIVATLRHTVGADVAYLDLLAPGTAPMLDEEVATLADLRVAADAVGRAWSALLDGDLDADAFVVRRRDVGSESHAPLGIRLAQAVHHGADHRSQVCTALTTLGIEPPEIDVWAYAQATGRLRQVPPPAETTPG